MPNKIQPCKTCSGLGFVEADGAHVEARDAARWRFVQEHGFPYGRRQIHPTRMAPTWGYDDVARFATPAEAVDYARAKLRAAGGPGEPS